MACSPIPSFTFPLAPVCPRPALLPPLLFLLMPRPLATPCPLLVSTQRTLLYPTFAAPPAGKMSMELSPSDLAGINALQAVTSLRLLADDARRGLRRSRARGNNGPPRHQRPPSPFTQLFCSPLSCSSSSACSFSSPNHVFRPSGCASAARLAQEVELLRLREPSSTDGSLALVPPLARPVSQETWSTRSMSVRRSGARFLSTMTVRAGRPSSVAPGRPRSGVGVLTRARPTRRVLVRHEGVPRVSEGQSAEE